MRATWGFLVLLTGFVSLRSYAPPASPLLVVPEALGEYTSDNADFHGASFFWSAEQVAATIAPVLVPGSPMRAVAQSESWNVNRVDFLTAPHVAPAFRQAWDTYQAFRASLPPAEQATVDNLVFFAITRSPADGDTDAQLRVPVAKHSPLVLKPLSVQRYVMAEVRFASDREQNPHPFGPLLRTVFNYYDASAHRGQAYARLYLAQNPTEYNRAHLDFSANAVTLSVTMNYYNNPSVADPFGVKIPFVGFRDGKAVYEIPGGSNRHGFAVRARVTVAPDGTTEVFSYRWEPPSFGRWITFQGGQWKLAYHFSGQVPGMTTTVPAAAGCGLPLSGEPLPAQ